jgi:HlyD family secretion protein
VSKTLSRSATLLLAWIGLACSSQQAGGPEPPVPAVEAVAARAGTLPLEERVSGVVRAEGQITVRPEIDAAVVSVHVRSGEAVSRGQLLVRLDERELREAQREAEATVRLEEAATAAARARVAELSAQVRRSRELAEQQLIARLEIETQEAQLAAAEASAAESAARVDQAKATLAQREQALSRTEIRAPVSGRVGRRNAEVGMLVGPSTVLFELGNLDNVRVEIPLTGEMLARVKPGQPVLVHPGQGAEPIAAKLTRVSPFLAAGSFSTTGEIDLPRGHAERLPPGLFVAVDLLYGESAPATLVPASALHEDPRTGVRGVYVLDLGGAKLTAGEALGERAFPARLKPVEVIGEGRQTTGVGGLEAGEWVVTVGQHLLAADGSVAARVRPVSWERVLGLQALQREDLLRAFLAEQRKVARERGAVPPDNREFQQGAR